jgi:hypothetical protein
MHKLRMHREKKSLNNGRAKYLTMCKYTESRNKTNKRAEENNK